LEFQHIISHLDWNDAAYIAYFYEGLKEDVREVLCMMDRPTTLSSMIETAIRIDNRLYERRLERAKTEVAKYRDASERPLSAQRPH